MKKMALIVAVVLTGILSVQANMLQNTGFETAGTDATKAQNWEWGNPDLNGSGWGTASRESWRSHAGTYEATICGSWKGDTVGGWWQQATGEAGVTYTASAWFWADSNWTTGEQGIKLEFYDTNLATPLLVVTNVISSVSTNWIQENVQAVAPQNTAFVRVVVYADNVGADGALQFDDVLLIAEPGTVIVISAIPLGVLLFAAFFVSARIKNRK